MLGYLTWTNIVRGELSLAKIAAAKIAGLRMPDRPLPIDVFRRVTGVESTRRYTLDDGRELLISCVVVEGGNPRMLERHMVVHTVRGAVTEDIVKVADVIFYKPPRGQWSKSRLRITPVGMPAEFHESVQAYTAGLRKQYEDGTAGSIDAQAIRRLVRQHLHAAQALPMGGPYFTTTTEMLKPLQSLFDMLGEGNNIHVVPLANTAEARLALQRAVRTADDCGQQVDAGIRSRLNEE